MPLYLPTPPRLYQCFPFNYLAFSEYSFYSVISIYDRFMGVKLEIPRGVFLAGFENSLIEKAEAMKGTMQRWQKLERALALGISYLIYGRSMRCPG